VDIRRAPRHKPSVPTGAGLPFDADSTRVAGGVPRCSCVDSGASARVTEREGPLLPNSLRDPEILRRSRRHDHSNGLYLLDQVELHRWQQGANRGRGIKWPISSVRLAFRGWRRSAGSLEGAVEHRQDQHRDAHRDEDSPDQLHA
jgi:hypothetical protein